MRMENKSISKKIESLTKLFEKNITKIASPLIALLIAMFLSVFLVMWAKNAPISDFLVILGEFSSIIYKSCFGSVNSFLGMLVYVTPMLFTGLAVAIAFRCGLFNIGVEGQFTVGMISASIIGLITGMSSWVHVVMVIVGGALAGGIWGLVPGYLKAKKGINEVIISIMLNYIALHVANWVSLRSALTVKGTNAMPVIEESAQLFRLGGPSVRLNISIFIALSCVIIVNFIINRTKTGYELRAVGQNKFAAEYAGISIPKNFMLAMMISGAIAGVGGATHLAGIQLRGQSMSGLLNYGFDGIAVALLARNNPIGCIVSAVLFGVLRASGPMLQIQGIPKEIVYLIQSIIIIFVAIDFLKNRNSQAKKVKANG
jgi:general nucleoside transport system permease protein